MAVIAEVEKISITNRLNIGLDPSGSIRTANMSLPSIDRSAYSSNYSTSRASVMAVNNALAPVLVHSIYGTRETVINEIAESD